MTREASNQKMKLTLNTGFKDKLTRKWLTARVSASNVSLLKPGKIIFKRVKVDKNRGETPSSGCAENPGLQASYQKP
jgi:hypothetical protein